MKGNRVREGIELMEEKIAAESEFEFTYSKFPKRIRDVLRKPNWSADYSDMFDDLPCCSDNMCCNYCCLSTVTEGDILLAWDFGKPKIFGPGMINLCC